MKVTIFASVEATTAARLSEAAARKGVPQSAVVAWALQHFLDEHEDAAITTTPGGNKSDRDGKDEVARAIIKANVTLTVTALIAKLKEMGIDRRKTWVTYQRLDARGTTVRLIEG
jgi:hypothetical protein